MFGICSFQAGDPAQRSILDCLALGGCIGGVEWGSGVCNCRADKGQV